MITHVAGSTVSVFKSTDIINGFWKKAMPGKSWSGEASVNPQILCRRSKERSCSLRSLVDRVTMDLVTTSVFVVVTVTASLVTSHRQQDLIWNHLGG